MSMVKLIAVGDICLQTRNNKHPFNHVKKIFKNKDILFGNLETVLSNQGEKAEKAVLLYSPSEKASYLKDAGFDILNIANNHIMDLGVEGFHNTLEILHRERDKKTNQSVILLCKIGKDRLRTHDIILVKINKDFVPYRVSIKEGKKIRLFILFSVIQDFAL